MGRSFDVIVVGAGPAGSSAAYTTAKAGLSTLLLERRWEIGVPVRCAEAISRVKLPEFVSPDPRWVAKVVHGARIVAPDGGHIDVVRHKDHEEGLVLERQIFDRHLAELAAQAGSEVRVKSRVVAVVREGNAITGVRVRSFGADEVIRSKIVIAADGVESQVGRWAGLETGPGLANVSVCVQYLLSGVRLERSDHLHLYIGSDVAPGGYAWAFPKGGDTWNVGLGIRPAFGGAKDQTAKQYLDVFVNKKFPGATPISLIMGAVPVGGRILKLSSDGIMVAGDAGHQVNPLTGSGITNAMKCAVLAAETAVDAFSRGDFSETFLSTYDTRYRKELGRKFAALARVRDAMARLDDEGLNRVVRKADRGGPSSWFEFVRSAIGTDPSVLAALAKLVMYGYFEGRAAEAPSAGHDQLNPPRRAGSRRN